MPDYPGRAMNMAYGQTVGSVMTVSTCVDPACHSLSAVGTPAFAEPACGSCHTEKTTTHGYDTVDHVASDAEVTGIACSSCHALDLKTEHDKASSSSAGDDCGTCHPTPRDSITSAWDQSCVTAGCHTVSSSAPYHAATETAHAIVPEGEVCTDCHAGTDLASIHTSATSEPGKTSCLVCHDSTSTPQSNDCTVCHFTFDEHYDKPKHESSWTLTNCNASGCHSSRDLMTVHNDHRTAEEGEFECSGCHDSARSDVVAAIAGGLTGCGDCHAGISETQGHRAAHWAEPLLEDADGPNYSYYTGSMGTQPTGDCAGCHVSNVIDEHMGIVDAESGNPIRLPRKDRNGDALTCASCHDSTDMSVRTAILAGYTKCDACHVTHGPIQEVHDSTFVTDAPVDCAASGCHTSSLVAEHNGGYTVTTPSGKDLTGCDVCHSYYEPTRGPVVQDAIEADNDVRCTACHEATHPDLGSHSATSTDSLECGSCHAKGETTIDIQAVHADASAGACDVCHANPARVPSVSEKTGECASCHSTEGSDYHRGLPAKHVYSEMPASCQSASCHPANVLPEAHEAYVAGTPADESTCDVCHANPDPNRIPANATAACDSCHTPIHPNMDHTADASQQCVDCHETGDVTVLHKKADGSTDCDVCHANPSRVPVLPASADCVNCHAPLSPVDPGHYPAVPHTSNDSSQYGYACSVCHKLEMKPEHVKASSGAVSCTECHEQKVDDFTGPWAKNCSACHGVQHGEISQEHASTSTECSGSGCHAVSNVGTLHAGASITVGGTTYTACRVCHRDSDTVPTSTTCSDCHDGHGDLTVAHTATASSACVSCHETGDVRSIHTDCAICHDGRALPATVDCANCHADVTPVDPNHYPAAPHLASETGCQNCHFLDMKQEHFKTASGPVSCVECHEQKVDAFTSGWNKTCAACHSVKHSDMNAEHVSTNTACGGSGCHNISDASDVHKGLPGGGCQVCHKSASEPATTTDCTSSGCHAGVTGNHEAEHDTTGVVDPGCKGCHYTYLTTEHIKLGYTCATCHSSSNSSVQAAISGGRVDCDACHPAVNGRDRHANQKNNEFIPGNQSGHRAYESLPGMRTSFKIGTSTYTWSLPSTSSFLKTGWTPNSVVTCDKCHTFSSSASGPHGAAVSVNIDPAYPGSYETARLGSTNSTIICSKCHTSYSNMNGVHSEGDHSGEYCIACHTKVPHGWRLPRLLAYTNDPSTYSSTRLTGLRLANHTPNNWSESDCSASCSDHSSTMSGRWPSQVLTFGTLTGVVRDASNSPISGVTVTITGDGSATTASDGRYTITGAPTGSVTVTASKTGHTSQSKTVTINSNQTATLDFALALAPVSANLALNKTATASSNYSTSYNAAKAVDGSTSTWWRSTSTGNQWLQVDLGSSTSVSKVVVNWNSSYYARSYRIETSTDGSSWTSRYSTSSGSSGIKTHTFAAVNARYVRLYCTSGYSSSYRVNEFEVWNF